MREMKRMAKMSLMMTRRAEKMSSRKRASWKWTKNKAVLLKMRTLHSKNYILKYPRTPWSDRIGRD